MQTRNNKSLFLGASPRASVALLNSAKALSAIRGRDFVTPEDVQQLAPSVLRHRIILTPEREMEGTGPDEVVAHILQKIEVPRYFYSTGSIVHDFNYHGLSTYQL